MSQPPMLLLAPSAGFGGGIERVAAAIEEAWSGELTRVDLYRFAHVRHPRGNPAAKVGFAGRAALAAPGARGGVAVALHIGLLPVLHFLSRVMSMRPFVVGHGVEVWSPPSRLARSLARGVGLVAVSSFTAEWISRRYGVPAHAVQRWHLPVAPGFAAAAQEGAPPDRDRTQLVVLTVSRVARAHGYKGHRVVAGALHDVLARGVDVRWVVMGGGDGLAELRDHCRSLGILDSVDIRGEVDEAALLDEYRSADVFVLPSVADPHGTPPEGEGFGLVYAEAAALRLPSVAARQGGGALDFVEHGETGWLVDGRDPRELADALCTLAESPNLRLRLGANAHRRLIARHLPARFAEELATTLA